MGHLRVAWLPLLTALASPLAAADEPAATCRWIEVEAWGRPGHGAALDLHTAPHRLIRALQRLTDAEGESWLVHVEITELDAGTAINVKPAEAVARARVDLAAGAAEDDDGLRERLLERLQPDAAASLLDVPCAPSGGDAPAG